MKLFLARHGESEGNILGLLQGHLDSPLSNLGKEQASKLAIFLKKERIDYVYSSDLKRAAETARAVINQQPNAKLVLTSLLRERDMGDFTGLKKTEVNWESLPNNFESDESVSNRLKNFINELLKNHSNDNILIVSHNQTQKLITSLILKRPISEVGKPLNTALSIFNIVDKSVTPELINSLNHLQ